MKNKIPNSIKKVLNFVWQSPYKSQKGQDKWVIHEINRGKRNGYFVDLAAADGVTHSNSYALEKKFAWDGICIEPNPDFFERMKRDRNCHLSNSAISNGHFEVTFRVDNGQLGGIVSEETDNNTRARGDQLENAQTITLQTEKLEDILSRFNAPKEIDYLSLDVEGSEEAVITSFDFNKYIFKAITIERPTPKLNECLFENGYIFVKNFRFDSFYVHHSLRDRVDCDKFEQIPPKDW